MVSTTRKPRRYRAHHVAAAALVAAMASYGAAHYQAPAAQSPVVPTQTVVQPFCDPALWQHVYHPDRFQVKQSCMEVSGTVANIRSEKDGDDHIQVSLDAAHQHLLNSANVQSQNGNLVVEVICAHQPTQFDAIQPCAGYTNTVYVPHLGERVTVDGSYVLDMQHGWNEIHPATTIVVN